MIIVMKSLLVKVLFKFFDLKLVTRVTSGWPEELSEEEKEIITKILKNELSMVSKESLIATALSCKYVLANEIPGDFVECGVFRGGNAILAASIFQSNGSKKKVWLFDTFEGNTSPNLQLDGIEAVSRHEASQRLEYNEWSYCSLEQVQENFRSFNLLSDKICFIKGDVRKTLLVAENCPKTISVLRLDTDWFDSTIQELKSLYPLLSGGNKRGVIIIDDYGYSSGARAATELYFTNSVRPFFVPIDNSARIGLKE